MQRLQPQSTSVIIIDVQERLAPAMPQHQYDGLLRSSRILLESARLFSIPLLVTEQYPNGLGPTIPEIADCLEPMQITPRPKMSFSAMDAEGFAGELQAAGVV